MTFRLKSRIHFLVRNLSERTGSEFRPCNLRTDVQLCCEVHRQTDSCSTPAAQPAPPAATFPSGCAYSAICAMGFERGPELDYLLLSREPVGGLWNNVPRNLLTLSPGQWMELAFYPMAQHAAENGSLACRQNQVFAGVSLFDTAGHITALQNETLLVWFNSL